MASHRRPKPASRTRVTVLTATAAAAVALASQSSASAAPAPAKPTVKSVKEQVDQLTRQAEQATQDYDGAHEAQQKLESEVDQLQSKVAQEQSQLNKLSDDFGAMASAQYRNGGIDPTVQLFLSSDPSSYLDQATMLDQVSGTQADELRQFQSEKRVLDQERAEANSKLAQLASARKELAEKKKQVKAKLAKAQDLLDSLTPAVRTAYYSAGALGDDPDLGDATAASQRAADALAYGKTKLGDPYVYGATGPNSFDCSGFVQWSYAQAGVSLPRTSEEQENVGPHLTKSELRPGDLVIFYGGEHVALYAGNGIVLHAPHTGASIEYENMNDMPFDFGVRVA